MCGARALYIYTVMSTAGILGNVDPALVPNATQVLLEQLGTKLLALDVRKADAIFFLFCSTLVFMMQVGFALLEVGSVSRKNTKNILLKNTMDLCVSSLSFYLIGYGLAWGDGSGFAGRQGFAMQTDEFSSLDTTGIVASKHAQAFFSLCFAATSATIVSGAVAERFRFESYAILSSVVAGIVFPVVVHWVWAVDGWLSPIRKGGDIFLQVGVIDYAGSGFVHVVGGLAAFWACVFVGPRTGRFSSLKTEPNVMPQQSPVFQVIGGLLMWYGWFGFNCGSIGTLEGGHLNSVVRVGVVHTVGGATGGIVAMILDQVARPGEYRPARMIHGVLCALVSISASAAFIEPSLSIFIGGVAGFIYTRASAFMIRLKIDDVVDAISIHLFGGIWGIIAASLVSRSGYLRQMNGPTYPGCGAFYGCSHGGKQIGTAFVYIFCILLWVTCTIVPVLLVLRRYNMLRVTKQAEQEGIDRATHGGDSYEEFQTTIFKLTNKKGEATSLETRVREGDVAEFALTLAKLLDADVNAIDGSSTGTSLAA